MFTSRISIWLLLVCCSYPFLSECGMEANKGLDILKRQLNIRKIKASFNFKMNEAYYVVRFCGKKAQPFCFITNIDDKVNENFDSEENRDVVRKIDLWMKLISTLSGKNYNIIPILKFRKLDDDRCRGNLYKITKGPSQAVMNEIIEEGKRRSICKTGKRKVNEPKCNRVCLKGESEKCDEIQLHCQFDGCRCYKMNLQELRRKSKKKTSLKKNTSSSKDKASI